MSLKATLLDLLGVGPQSSALGYEEPDSFEAVQRARFLFANIVGLSVVIAIGIVYVLQHGLFPLGKHIIVSGYAVVFHLLCLCMAYRIANIGMLCRLWAGLCSLFLCLDIAYSGGVSTSWAMMFMLLPIGAGLILERKDVLIFTAFTAFAVATLGVASISVAPVAQQNMLLADTLLLIVGSIISGMAVVVLITHYEKIDMNRRLLLQSKDYVASHDGLTGLYNRSVVTRELGALSPGTSKVNLFLADLDKFKDVNDAYGHQVGDELLVQVAARLRETAPEGAIVARLGGDEFFILVKANAQGETLGWPSGGCLGKAVVSALSEPFLIGDLELNMSGSVGVGHFPADATTGEELLHKSDLALYAAKAAGRNQCFKFLPEMEAAQNRQIALQSRLREALDRDEIFLCYQPQFCLTSHRLMGFEALARWDDAELGVVGPDTFVKVAEDCGMIEQLGEQVLRRACREALEWPLVAGEERPIRLSVNISALQLKTTNIVPRIASILAETGFPAGRLELEVTETVLISDPQQVILVLNDLADMGIEIAMDDFGKGYSSLSYLQDFSLSRLKIDRSFITNLSGLNGKPIVSAIIQLAQAMGLKVVAEGVETDDQRRALKDMGCHFAQGFLYAPGLSPADALKLIINSAARTGHAAKPAAPNDQTRIAS